VTQPDPEIHARRTRTAYRRGIANGILFAIGMAFVDPVTVLPTFVSRLTTSEVAVGLISTLGMSGWFLPQLISARYLQPRPHKRPLYIVSATFRALGLLALVPLTYFLALGRPTAALIAFFISYSIYSFSGGLSGPAFLDIVAKTVPANRLGAFFGHRQFWGGLGAIACGLLVRTILAADAIPFPLNYSLMFGIALASFAPGWILFGSIYEPPGRTTKPEPLLSFFRSGPEIIRRHRDFRLLTISRILTGCAAIALPFYIIYCRRLLEVPESAVGTYLSIQMAGSVILIPLWAYLNDHRGPRTLLVTLAALSLAVPTTALFASLLPASIYVGRIVFGLVFLPLASLAGGGFMAYTNYLFAIAPEERRTLYIGVHNTLFAITAFLPLLGGLVVKHFSFHHLFAIAAIMALLGLLATVKLPARRASVPE
jgi:MFS family permease